MQKYTAAPQVQSEQNTVLALQNRPLRPRAEGEMVWQPERRTFQAANLVKPLPAAVIRVGIARAVQILVAKRFTTQAS